jgi:prepilin-type N-terminal cleavage/methylation domain-containing protein
LKRKGITLIELIAVIAIVSIVFTMMYSVLSDGNIIYKRGVSDTRLQENARKAMYSITASIKDAEEVQKLDTVSNKVSVNGLNFNFNNNVKAVLYVNPKDNTQEEYMYVLVPKGSLNVLYKANKAASSTGLSSLIEISSNITAITVEQQGISNFVINVSVKIDDKAKSYSTSVSLYK